MLEWQVAVSDGLFRVGVVGAGIVLAAGITAVRFCGSVSLPPKPAGPAAATQQQLITKSVASPTMYRDFLGKDAALAGVRTPTVEDMSKKLVFRLDEGRRVLEVGQRPVEVAGLALVVQRNDDALVLDITNVTGTDIAYQVVTTPSPNLASCTSVAPLPFNAMVIAKAQHETRVECAWRKGMSIVVTRVETVELSPLAAWYVAQLPPAVVGIDDRIARGHRAPQTGESCSTVIGQVVKNGLETGQIAWRDLIDFYARHRCQTYQFPASYRAFTADNQQAIPASASGM
jgi:hypothetical protein